MKYCYKCKTTKEFDLFGKNKSRKDGLSDECRDCKRHQDREYAVKHREEAKKRASDWYYNNKEHANKRSKVYGAFWRTHNKDKQCAKANRYRSSKLQATPKWLSQEQHKEIESFYWLSRLQNELTDAVYHVDHIVPLKGKTVCGLNVPWNLQIIPALDNIRKGNKIVLS